MALLQCKRVRGRKVEIVIAAPRAFEKNEKVVDNCSTMIEAGCKAVQEALELAKANTSAEKLQMSYESTCIVRLQILQMWQSATVADIPPKEAQPSTPTPESGAIQAQAAQAQMGGNTGADTSSAEAAQAQTGSIKGNDAGQNPASAAKSSASITSPGLSAAVKVSVAIRKALEPGAGNSAAQHVSDVAHALCRAEMMDIHQSLLNCESVDALDQQVEKLKNAATVVKQLKDGAVKAAGSLKTHIQNRKKALKRKLQQTEKQNEMNEMNARKKQAKEAALEVKKQADAVPAIFLLDVSSLKNAEGALVTKNVPVLSNPTHSSINSVDAPCCIANLGALNTFMKNPRASWRSSVKCFQHHVGFHGLLWVSSIFQRLVEL